MRRNDHTEDSCIATQHRLYDDPQMFTPCGDPISNRLDRLLTRPRYMPIRPRSRISLAAVSPSPPPCFCCWIMTSSAGLLMSALAAPAAAADAICPPCDTSAPAPVQMQYLSQGLSTCAFCGPSMPARAALSVLGQGYGSRPFCKNSPSADVDLGSHAGPRHLSAHRAGFLRLLAQE